MLKLKMSYAYDPVELLFFCKVNTAMRKLSFWSYMNEIIHGAVYYHGFLEVHMRVVETLSRYNGFGFIKHFLCLKGA